MEYEKKANSGEETKKPETETEEDNFIDSIQEILSLNNQSQIDNKIFENTINIINFFKEIDKKLYDEFNLDIREVKILIKCLKFVDTLNLFMNQASINNLIKLIYNINDSLILINSISFKDDILYQIKYTEKSLIYYKKPYFKSLFFQSNESIYDEFDKILDENNLYDVKTFKQIQNLFYIFSMKLDEKYKEVLVKKINYLKSIILPPRKGNFYDTSQQPPHDKFRRNYFNDYDNFFSSRKYGGNYVDTHKTYNNNTQMNNNFNHFEYGKQGYYVSNQEGYDKYEKYDSNFYGYSNPAYPGFQQQYNNKGYNSGVKNVYNNVNNNYNNNSGNRYHENSTYNEGNANIHNADYNKGNYKYNNYHQYQNKHSNNFYDNHHQNKAKFENINTPEIMNNKDEYSEDKTSKENLKENTKEDTQENAKEDINVKENLVDDPNKGGIGRIIDNNKGSYSQEKAKEMKINIENTTIPSIPSEGLRGIGSYNLASNIFNNEKLELIDVDINKMFDISPTHNTTSTINTLNPSSDKNTKNRTQEDTKPKSQEIITNPSYPQRKKVKVSSVKDVKVVKDIKESEPEDDLESSGSSKNDDFDDIEEFEDEEDEEQDEQDELDNFIKQDIEDQLNSELYSKLTTKNDKVIFGNETKISIANIEEDTDDNLSSPNKLKKGSEDSDDLKNKGSSSNEFVLDNKNIKNSTPYIPLSSQKQDKQDQDKDKQGELSNMSSASPIEGPGEESRNKISPQSSSQVQFRGKDSTIHKEYFSLKIQEQSNPNIFTNNIEMFEHYIMLPIYQKISIGVYKKKINFFLTFTKYKNLIQRVLKNSKMLKKVKPYGSYVNNFLTESGDIDICIVPVDKCKICDFSKYLEKVKEAIIEKDIGEYRLSHYGDRYLLLKIIDRETQFVVDITVHTMLPIYNSKLVKIYSHCDQRFHIMGIFLKHWAKINKIHGAADNYLSSYALLIMLIYFLQKVIEPRILPNLQKVERQEKMYSYKQGGAEIQTNVFFEENPIKIKKELDRINDGQINEESAASLLVKFFEYYSYYFENQLLMISISEEQPPLKTELESYAFSIVDPFDPTHNPGRSLTLNSPQFNKFITAMKKEINYILTGEYIKRIDTLIK